MHSLFAPAAARTDVPVEARFIAPMACGRSAACPAAPTFREGLPRVGARRFIVSTPAISSLLAGAGYCPEDGGSQAR